MDLSGIFDTCLTNILLFRMWANHQIEVRGDSISWFQEGKLMAASVIAGKSITGYFGIRKRYERGTRYDHVKILVLK